MKRPPRTAPLAAALISAVAVAVSSSSRSMTMATALSIVLT